MRIIIFLFLAGFSVIGFSETVTIFGKNLKINAQCNIEFLNKKNKVEIVKLGLPEKENCKFVKHSSTDIVNLSRITNAYMFFVFSPYEHNNQCMSKYTAILITNDGKIKPSNFVKRSGFCPKTVEKKEFEYFSYKMKIMK